KSNNTSHGVPRPISVPGVTITVMLVFYAVFWIPAFARMTSIDVNRHHQRPVATFCIHHSDFCLNSSSCPFDVQCWTFAVLLSPYFFTLLAITPPILLPSTCCAQVIQCPTDDDFDQSFDDILCLVATNADGTWGERWLYAYRYPDGNRVLDWLEEHGNP